MYHFVMRQRQDEVLVMMIEHGEGEIVLMILAMNRVAFEVVQRVVHPAHVPFKGKAEASEIRRTRDQWPGRRFLSHGDDAGVLGVHEVIEFSQEIDRFEIFTSAE